MRELRINATAYTDVAYEYKNMQSCRTLILKCNLSHRCNRRRTEGTYVGRLDSGFGMHLMISPRVKVISPVSPDETSKKSHRQSAISPIRAVYEGGNNA